MNIHFRRTLAALLCLALVLPMASELQAAPARRATVTYDYDAFGNLIHSTGTTPNNYLFAAEQFDPDLGLYYNRARYLNTSTGRFWSMDSFEGDDDDPPSLHKYTYTGNDPVNGHDATGFQTEVEEAEAEAVDAVINSLEQQLRYDRILRFVRVATTGVVLLATALSLEGDNSPTPNTRDKTKKPKMLYRFGFDRGGQTGRSPIFPTPSLSNEVLKY